MDAGLLTFKTYCFDTPFLYLSSLEEFPTQQFPCECSQSTVSSKACTKLAPIGEG